MAPSASDKRLTPADLSEDQRLVYDEIVAWSTGNAASRNASFLAAAGFAGTGKSTVLSVFAANTTLLVAYIAFTGRASSILKRKLKACGVTTTTDTSKENRHSQLPLCTTIHGLLYKPVVDQETEELRGFEKRTKLDRAYDIIVIDEASMVSDEMLADLKVHGVPILAVGDHGQLPPVMSSGSCVQNPDLRLEKIHRQAADNPIIKLSRRLRKFGDLHEKYCDGKRVVYRSKSELNAVLAEADVRNLGTGILCWMNRSRVMLNGRARRAIGLEGAPKAGELVIALKNKPPVYNGMRGVLVGDAIEPSDADACPWYLRANIQFPDEGLFGEPHVLCASQFNREVVFKDVEELRKEGIDVRAMSMAGEFYDFGYALTVHRSQGSSFKHAIVFLDRKVEPESEDWRRWIYTAVTRASEKVTILL